MITDHPLCTALLCGWQRINLKALCGYISTEWWALFWEYPCGPVTLHKWQGLLHRYPVRARSTVSIGWLSMGSHRPSLALCWNCFRAPDSGAESFRATVQPSAWYWIALHWLPLGASRYWGTPSQTFIPFLSCWWSICHQDQDILKLFYFQIGRNVPKLKIRLSHLSKCQMAKEKGKKI